MTDLTLLQKTGLVIASASEAIHGEILDLSKNIRLKSNRIFELLQG
jgi:hypothetical protein